MLFPSNILILLALYVIVLILFAAGQQFIRNHFAKRMLRFFAIVFLVSVLIMLAWSFFVTAVKLTPGEELDALSGSFLAAYFLNLSSGLLGSMLTFLMFSILWGAIRRSQGDDDD